MYVKQIKVFGFKSGAQDQGEHRDIDLEFVAILKAM